MGLEISLLLINTDVMQLTVMIKIFTEYEATKGKTQKEKHFMTSGAGPWYVLFTMEVITELLCMLCIGSLQLHEVSIFTLTSRDL